MRIAILLVTIAVFLAAISMTTVAQDEPEQVPPCAEPEASQFDFWVGEWNLSWGDSGQGKNVITRELGGCVIEENFTTLDDQPFVGRSLSVFDKHTKKWKQTWVDNSGGYLDFTGGMEGNRMILMRQARPVGKEPFLQRMVFYNIEADSLDWNWEKSTDGGETWENLWHIHYVRER